MEPAVQAHPPSIGMRACFVSSLFFVVAVVMFIQLIEAFKSQPISEGASAILASPWGLTALLDYVVGAVFGFMFIWLRQTPSMLFVNHKIIAIIFPFVGNFLLLLYMSYVIFTYKSVDLTFVPKSVSPGEPPMYDPPANQRQTKFVGLLFSALCGAFCGICIWALSVQSISDGLNDFRANRWVKLSFQDSLGGLLFTFVYVVVREEGVPSIVVPWFLGFALLGNFATCFYVIKLAYESMRRDVSFSFLFFSRSKRY